MPKKIYYARHGHTHDLHTKHRSRRTTTLTDQGRKEARAAGELLRTKDIMPGRIVCSSLRRAIQSANIAAGVLGYAGPVLANSVLDERLWGEAEGMPNAEIKQRWDNNFDIVPGAETVEALQQRAVEAVAWLKGLDEEIVFVMGHGTIGRAIIRVFEGRPFTDEYNGERGDLENGETVRLYPQPTTKLL